ncbi:hypothetical protein [Xanthobacter sp.]|uniref:hypothetical protein n=1 Tax=Xanthobacter sp. TaxID=35809 RepID=UPI0035ADF178
MGLAEGRTVKDQPWTSPDARRWKRWAGNVILVLCVVGAWILYLLDPIVRLWRWWFGV